MYTYIAQRLLITIPLLLGLTFVIFMIIQIAPGDFFDQWALQPDLDQRQLRQWKREFGADKGWIAQYVRWLRGVLFDVRFASERTRIGDFEYDTLAENRKAYDIQGTPPPSTCDCGRWDLRAGLQFRRVRRDGRAWQDG